MRQTRRRLRWTRLIVPAGLAGWAAYRYLNHRYGPRFSSLALHAGYRLTGIPRSVVAVAPRPMDLEFYAGGTLRLMVTSDSTIDVAVATDDAQAARRRNGPQIRRREQEAAAAVIGYRQVQFWALDRRPAGAALIHRLDVLVNEVQPDLLMVIDPDVPPMMGSRRDLNERTAAAAMEVSRLRDLPLWFYGSPRPNVTVDITGVIKDKIRAVKCHRTLWRGPTLMYNALVKVTSAIPRGTVPAKFVESWYRA